MIRSIRRIPARLVSSATVIAALSACATAPVTAALAVGQQAAIEGEVLRVDTGPWAYDGHAVVTVSTSTAGIVNVQLPARWNLCKAAPPDAVQELKPHDRVEAAGTVTATDALVVCEQPQHHLRKVE